MSKIFIIGSSGSGKTTLALELSAALHIPHYDLDKIGWKHGENAIGYVEEAIAIAGQADWAAEGNFIIWTDPLLYAADTIVLLEISWPVAAWRILTRHISKSLRGVNPYPGWNGVKLLYPLLKDTRIYCTNKVSSHPIVAESARRYIEEHEADPALMESETLVARWDRCAEEIPLTADFVRMYLNKFREKLVVMKNNADRKRLLEMLTKRS